jgi:hypothetical protein
MLTIREVEDKDIIPLAEFLPKGFPYSTKDFWLRLFELWWTSNPAYTDQSPRGWVLEKDMSVVGFIGNIPVKFLIRGVVRIAAASNSWYVDPSVRGIYSLRLFNEFLKQKSASLLLFKKDDESLMEILHNYKFREYIVPWNQKEYVYIIDKKKVGFIFLIFLLKLRMPQLCELSELYKKFGFLFFSYFYQKPVIQGTFLTDEAHICSLCTSCDEAFFKIWEPYLNSCDLSLSRDTKTLNWLYFSSARLYKRVVIQCHRSQDKTLAGYMVFDVQRIRPSDDGIMKLMDMCIENNDPKVLASLTSYAIKIGKQNNAALLVVWANNQETEKYFRSTIAMRMSAKYYRHFRFSDSYEINSGGDNDGTVCLPMIYAPQ